MVSRIKIIAAGFAGLLLACVAGGFIALAPLLPISHQWARQRWERQGIRNYEVEASWASGWSYGHVRVEVRDGKVIRGVDLETGMPLEPRRLVNATPFVRIDYLFRMIEEQTRPSSDWRYQLARYHPLLAHRLDPCAALLPNIRYDQRLGYPTSISYRGSPCFNGENVFLTIKAVRPLP